MPSNSIILGYKVFDGSMSHLVSKISGWLESSTVARYLVCLNPHSFVVSQSDTQFSTSIREADIVLPDGQGIVLASRLLGGAVQKRLTGPDIFLELMTDMNSKHGLSCFFLGSSQETLDKIVRNAGHDYRNIRIAGVYSPPFSSEFSSLENEKIIELINVSNADVLWVGLTAPKQEKWIFAHKDRLNVKFIGAIGAVFDFYAGNVKKAHPVFSLMGFPPENWLVRLLQNPRRLWRRTFVSAPKFLFALFIEIMVRYRTLLIGKNYPEM